jgi:FkbM family methyltransferase
VQPGCEVRAPEGELRSVFWYHPTMSQQQQAGRLARTFTAYGEPMISYTRSFEDIMLQRVFRDVEAGCYLDVGACIPRIDSNTFALYDEKQWRGICIEPLGPLGLSDHWKEVRPEDIFITAAAGREEGSVQFHIYDQAAQVSTGSLETVEHWKKNDLTPSRVIDVPVHTLNSLLERHLNGRVLHLVSIDVEGMEKEVLLGFDLRKYRPWVMIIEAVLPGAQIPSHEKWESLVLEAGYTMAYFDGVNRFYVLNEREDLLERFRLPPNAFDNIEFVATIDANHKCTLLQQEVEKLEKELSEYRRAALAKPASKRKFSLAKFFTDLKF